ncbi:MAG: hypothetical protein H6719_32950 [Sandaracinaceae bacterium]|nr:hypothetical protein [Sandaracinaceae bacterium]
MTQEMPDELPPLVREVLAVFEEELSEVRFGDLDAARLQEVAARVRAAELDVEEARVRLDATKRLYEEELANLGALAQRALAYARIYADHDPALADRLAPLASPGASPPRRKRKRKSDGEVDELPFEATERPLRVAAG